MNLSGVSTGPWDVWQDTFREKDFQDLKALGVNYIKSTCHLGNLVNDAYELRTAPNGETCLNNWIKQIQFMTNAGILVTPDVSLSSGGPQNEDTFWDGSYGDFVNLWKVLTEIFKEIPGIASLHILHVPGHKGTGTRADWEIITDLTIPAIRKIWPTVKISWMPYLMGWKDYEGYQCHTGYYADAEPLPFANIEYCFNHYASQLGGVTAKVAYSKEDYTGDIEPLRWHMEPAINFKQKYGVPMMCAEWGLKDPDFNTENRIGWVRDMMALFSGYGFDQAYWNLAIPSGYGGDLFSILRDDRTWRTYIIDQIRSTSAGLSWELVGLVLMLKELFG